MDNSLIKENVFSNIKDNSIQNIIKVVVESVEDLNVTGKEKKVIAMVLIKEYIGLMPNNDYKIILLSTLEAGVFDEMVDLVILASRKQLNLNKKSAIKIIIKYLNCCISILNKKSK